MLLLPVVQAASSIRGGNGGGAADAKKKKNSPTALTRQSTAVCVMLPHLLFFFPDRLRCHTGCRTTAASKTQIDDARCFPVHHCPLRQVRRAARCVAVARRETSAPRPPTSHRNQTARSSTRAPRTRRALSRRSGVGCAGGPQRRRSPRGGRVAAKRRPRGV